MRCTIRKIRLAAMVLLVVFLVSALTGNAWAVSSTFNGKSWQIGDIIVCFGVGKCNVIRIEAGVAKLLDQVSDGLSGHTTGVAINNTLHTLVTDNQGGGGSKVVLYSIASVNPLTGMNVAHTPLQTFDATGSGGPDSPNAQAVAIDSAGNMFVGNAGNGGSPVPSIVELDVHGTVVGTFVPSSVEGCGVSTLTGLDVGSDGNVYFTAGDGTIRKVTTPINGSSSCSAITITEPGAAGSSIVASRIRAIPSGALPDSCGVELACPAGGFLVTASGTVTFGEITDNVCTLDTDTTTSCALLLDTTGTIVRAYPVAGVPGLKALTLDPFVTDCSGSGGTACASSYTSAPRISNFWVGDFGSSNFYKLDFATGTAIMFDANLACTGCSMPTSIEGLGIYGGESAHQPGLAKLSSSSLVPSSGTASASPVQFVQNTEVVTLYNLTLNPTGLGLYASLVDGTSCFNDQDPALACKNTTSAAGKAIVWKIDVPQGSTASLGGSASIAGKYSSTVVNAIDNGTDVFTDMLYDTTVLVGNTDPGQFTKPSVQSLHEVPFTATGGANCAFSSPVANTCYKTNRTTLPFVIPQCSGMLIADFSTLGLRAPAGGLSLVQTFGTFQAPLPVDLSGTNGGATNGKASFRYDATKNQWVYQFALSSLGGRTGTFTGCAFDSTHKAQTFCVTNIKFQKSCP